MLGWHLVTGTTLSCINGVNCCLIPSPCLSAQPPYVAPECFDTNNKSLTAKAVSVSHNRLTSRRHNLPWPFVRKS